MMKGEDISLQKGITERTLPGSRKRENQEREGVIRNFHKVYFAE